MENLKELREKYIQLGKEMAGHESTLKILKSQQSDIHKKLEEMNIKPKELNDALTLAQSQLATLTDEIARKLNPDENQKEVIETIEIPDVIESIVEDEVIISYQGDTIELKQMDMFDTIYEEESI